MVEKINWKTAFDEKLRHYRETSKAAQWLDSNFERIQYLFDNAWIRDFIFEPIKDVFVLRGASRDDEIRAAITRVAVANAVLAGLPGKMGVGVVVSMGLEGWMAYVIASRVGVKIDNVSDVWKYFGMLATIIVTIFWLIKAGIGLFFSAFSIIPSINPLIFAELAVTNLAGVLFWTGFVELKSQGSFTVPKRTFLGIYEETKSLFSHQYQILKNALTPTNLKMMAGRLWAWLKGEIPLNKPMLRGEIFPTLAMTWLLAHQYKKLEGPLGQEFVGAIRDRFPDLADATISEIADYMDQYDAEAMVGVLNVIKGKLFERLVALYENNDDDKWTAALHSDESYPGSDIIFTNEETGEVTEISLKATDNPTYVEEALLKYPDIPLMTTDEVTEYFDGHEVIFGSGMTNAYLEKVTEENFDKMLQKLTPADAVEIAATEIGVKTAMSIWPFVMAYAQQRIRYEQLEIALTRVAGDTGTSLASRISYALVLGPVFAWYLLARGVMKMVPEAQPQKMENIRYLQYQPANR